MGRHAQGSFTHHAFSVLGVAVAVVAVASCGGHASLKPLPTPEGQALLCDDAYVLDSDLERPSRLEVWNQTGADLRIALDACGRNQHLGWVRSGTLTAFQLPETLVNFPDGLRLRAYQEDGEYGVFGVNPGELVPRLVIPAQAEDHSR